MPCLLWMLWAGWRSRYSDRLRAGRSGDRIPVGTRFSTPVQTGPGAHPASCTMGTGSFREGKERPGPDADPLPPSNAVGHKRVELYLYSPYGPYGLYRASVPVQGVHFMRATYCTYLIRFWSPSFKHVEMGNRHLDRPRYLWW